MIIRRARVSDFNITLDFLLNADDEMLERLTLYPYNDLGAREISQNSHGINYLAILDGKVIGLGFLWMPIGFNEPTLSFGVGILRKYRRKGIGMLLLNNLIKRAREMGAKRLMATTSNPQLLKLLKKLGFKISIIDPKDLIHRSLEGKEYIMAEAILDF